MSAAQVGAARQIGGQCKQPRRRSEEGNPGGPLSAMLSFCWSSSREGEYGSETVARQDGPQVSRNEAVLLG